MEKLYSLKESASLFSVSRLTVYRWIKEGKIKALKLPDGRLRIPESQMDLLIKQSNPQWNN